MNPRQHHPQPPLTEQERIAAAALGPFIEKTRANIDRATEMIELRKWVVDRAVQIFPTYCMNDQGTGGHVASHIALTALLQQLHSFVRAPLDQAMAELEDKAKGR